MKNIESNNLKIALIGARGMNFLHILGQRKLEYIWISRYWGQK